MVSSGSGSVPFRSLHNAFSQSAKIFGDQLCARLPGGTAKTADKRQSPCSRGVHVKDGGTAHASGEEFQAAVGPGSQRTRGGGKWGGAPLGGERGSAPEAL